MKSRLDTYPQKMLSEPSWKWAFPMYLVSKDITHISTRESRNHASISCLGWFRTTVRPAPVNSQCGT
eukprot:scaffold12233_cov226-Chaetoceros_neogracile.AAC.2